MTFGQLEPILRTVVAYRPLFVVGATLLIALCIVTVRVRRR